MLLRNFTFTDTFWWNFYVVDRNKTTFQNIQDVPDFTGTMIPMFFTMIVLENVFRILLGKGSIRINDSIGSLSLGMTMEITRLLTKGLELIGYQWLYDHRFIDLDWNSSWTWWGAAIGVDFGYYWVHRASHELNLFWSGHQVHHSSEEYNLTTALRQSAFQRFFSVGFYHPLALLGIPPAALLVHFQFSLFYQFWIHTELIPNLGPLEYIFNTASHHRVHHGMNKWCLDKNYAAALIIWDRIFGTFQQERTDEEIIYGLVVQPQTFEPLYLQVFYFKAVLEKTFSMDTYVNKAKALFYGPGWHPGTERLGDLNELPDKTVARKKHHVELPTFLNIYLISHFFIMVLVQQNFLLIYGGLSWISVLIFITLIFTTLFVIGSFLDGQLWVAKLEAMRCAIATLIVVIWNPFPYPPLSIVTAIYFIMSAVIWAYQSKQLTHFTSHKQKCS